MKSLLIQDFTKYDNHRIAAFLQHYKMFNVHVIIPGDAFTDQVLKLVNRFALNVIIPIHCVENGHESVAQIELRNPGFEERLLAAPASKVNILRQSTLEVGGESIVALAMSFPNIPVWMVRNPDDACCYYDDIGFMRAFCEKDTPLPNLKYRFDLRTDFTVLSYETLEKVGMAGGDKECLVLVK